MPTRLNFFLVILFSCCILYCKAICPEPCKCPDKHASCRNSSLTEIIDNIPDKSNSLDYSYNRLSEIPNEIFITKNLLNLEDLNLDWNYDVKLHPDSFKGLTRLRWLYISGDNIHQLNPDQFKYNPILEKLIMFHNVITLPSSGPLLNSISLRELWLGRCDITSIPNEVFSGLPNLELLDLRGNNIQVLRQKVFQTLKNLKTLYLDDNKIKILQTQTFDPLHKIEAIHLSNNDIKYLPIQIIDKPKLKEVSLQKNPFHCDCRLHKTWWKLSINGVKNENAVCTTPRNTTWDEFYQNDECDDDEIVDRIGEPDYVSAPPSSSTKRTTTTEEISAGCVIWGDEGC